MVISRVWSSRTVSETSLRFAAMLGRDAIAFCEWSVHLLSGGEISALTARVKVEDLWVQDDWRTRGIGSWLGKSACARQRLGGCGRVILAVSFEQERSGAARYYELLGRRVLTRLQRGHARTTASAES